MESLSGNLFVVGHDRVVIALPEEPFSAEVHFIGSQVHHPCNPTPPDQLAYEFREVGDDDCDGFWELIIVWWVSDIRQINWRVHFR